MRQSIPDEIKGEGSSFLSELNKLKNHNNTDNSSERDLPSINNSLDAKPVSPEKFIFQELDKKSRNSGYFIKETGDDKNTADKRLRGTVEGKSTGSGLKGC